MQSRVSNRHQRLPDPAPVIHGLSKHRGTMLVKGRFVRCWCFFAAVFMLLFLQPGVFDQLHSRWRSTPHCGLEPSSGFYMPGVGLGGTHRFATINLRIPVKLHATPVGVGLPELN
jgi:hypothetical protein